MAKIKSDDFEFPLEEFIKVDEKLQILSDVLEPARNSKRSSAFWRKQLYSCLIMEQHLVL